MPDSQSRHPRVLVVSLGRRGGVTDYGWHMARALAGATEVAGIISAFADSKDKWRSLDCPVLQVPTFNGMAGMLASYFAWPRFFRMWRFAREFRPDVIYYPSGHSWKPVLDLILPRSAVTLLTVHDPSRHEGEDSVLGRIFDWLNRRRVGGYVLLNHAQATEYAERLSLKEGSVEVIPLGVLDDYVPEPDSAAVVEQLSGISPDDLGRYLLFVGRILPYKGIDVLLEAYQQLDPAVALPLVIAGRGQLSPTEQTLLDGLRNRRVHVRNDWLTDSQMAALVKHARFVVLPYRSATQTGVIPMASAFGVPAIASATAGIVEQVVDGETGVLVPPSDVVALANALRDASAIAPAEYQRMSSACSKYAEDHWQWDALARQLLNFAEGLRNPG